MLHIVVIDPGHGGTDRANRGPTGYIEADGALDISLKMKDMFLDYQEVYVEMTRETDKTMSLKDRGLIGSEAFIFLPIHTNADGGAGQARGSETIYSVDIPEDKEIANLIAKNIADKFAVPNRGAKTKESTKYPNEDYYTVIDTAQDHGAKHIVLIEALFHNNKLDEKILLDPENRTIIAQIIVETVANYYGFKKRQNVSSWAAESWDKAIKAGINDGEGPQNKVTEEQLMVFFDRLGLLESGEE